MTSPTPSSGFFELLEKKPRSEYRKLLLGLLAFTLFNSSDVFLLLKAKASGLNDTWVIGLYIFYNLIYALTAFPLGILADKSDSKKMYSIGLLLLAIVYLGMATTCNAYTLAVWFLLYGLYAAATEGIFQSLDQQHLGQSGYRNCDRHLFGFSKHLHHVSEFTGGADLVAIRGRGHTGALSGLGALVIAGYVVLAIPVVAKS